MFLCFCYFLTKQKYVTCQALLSFAPSMKQDYRQVYDLLKFFGFLFYLFNFEQIRLLIFQLRQEESTSLHQFSSVSLLSILFTVFLTAVRSSRRRQHYNIGFMDEFINAIVSVKFHALVKWTW